MKQIILIALVLLQGCAAVTRRNTIDLIDERKVSQPSFGNLLYDDSDFTIRIYNLNSGTDFLLIGVLVPIIPVGLFSRDLTSSGHLKLQFGLLSKSENPAGGRLDFADLAFEEILSGQNKVCENFEVRELLKNNTFAGEFYGSVRKEMGPAVKLYQLECRLPYKSAPYTHGPFLRIKGIKAVDGKKSFTIPDLTMTYRNKYQFEFFSPN
jgi:hypothetical protein